MDLNSPYDVLVPWCKLTANAGLSDADRLVALHAPTITTVGTISKESFAPLLAVAIGRVCSPGFSGNLTYWTMILNLWTSLDLVHPTDPSTQGVIAVALANGVLLQSEVTAVIGSVTTQISQLQAWGIDVTPGHLASARTAIEEGA